MATASKLWLQITQSDMNGYPVSEIKFYVPLGIHVTDEVSLRDDDIDNLL